MIERLRHALEHVEELSVDTQEQLAEIIERQIHPLDNGVSDLAGAWSDLPDTFDQMLNTLGRIRHDSPPTPSIEDMRAFRASPVCG